MPTLSRNGDSRPRARSARSPARRHLPQVAARVRRNSSRTSAHASMRAWAVSFSPRVRAGVCRRSYGQNSTRIRCPKSVRSRDETGSRCASPNAACHPDAAPATVNEVEDLHPATVRRHGKAQIRVPSPREPGDRPGASGSTLRGAMARCAGKSLGSPSSIPLRVRSNPFASRG